jgi:protein-disulfide isomerase
VITQYGQTQAVARTKVNGMAMGNPDAPVKVEEFADFQCPSCGYFVTDTEPTIIKDYISTDKVYFEFHNLAFLGNESIAAAEAAYCANDQGKFWEYHDMVFKNQRGENQGWFSTARLTTFAKDVGLNVDTFSECYTSGKFKQKVNEDRAYADSLKITRTPSFLVNGQLAYADTLVKMIESQLLAAGK